MSAEIFKYLVTGFYVIATFVLSWIGMRRTRDLRGFSIGNKDMNPYLIGITLAASIASTATFVINPGFVYTHGVSAYLHYGVAASSGILVAFLTLTRGFLRVGDQHGALTIPEWIYHRYQHRGFSLFFAFINLLSITFVVLILVGCSLLMMSLFGMPREMALVGILLFVFSYVLMGGTYAHAYTNTLQGLMMLAISLFLFINGLKYFDEGILASLGGIGDHYVSVFNPDSNLYYDFFSVFGSGFIITFALMLQPHILTKVLYLKGEGDINKFIITTVLVGFCFALMLALGFYAQLAGVQPHSQDSVVTEYLLLEFSQSAWGQYILTFIFITLLAAGMSTLDGILVSLSAMVVNDIYRPIFGGAEGRNGLLVSRIVLVLVGIFAGLLAWNPPQLVGLFAQKGVYGLAAASLVPLLFGVLAKRPLPLWIIAPSAFLALFLHLGLHLLWGVDNPAVSASYAILAALALTLLLMGVERLWRSQRAGHSPGSL